MRAGTDVDPNSWSGGVRPYAAVLLTRASSNPPTPRAAGQRDADGQRLRNADGNLPLARRATLVLNGSISLTGNGAIDFFNWYAP